VGQLHFKLYVLRMGCH